MKSLSILRTTTLLFALCLSTTSWAQAWKSGVDKYENGDYGAALGELQPLANRGDMVAQTYLSLMYRNGLGVKQDSAQMRVWGQKAEQQAQPRANRGDAVAQFILGVIYERNLDKERIGKEYIAWYRKAAEQGFAYAQYKLGAMYDSGKTGKLSGDRVDILSALAWYRKAAEQGHMRAQFILGEYYASGRGVKKDKAQALAWYGKAAEEGHWDAQILLGYEYYYGRNVEKDISQAVKWWVKTARDPLKWEPGQSIPQSWIRYAYIGMAHLCGQHTKQDYARAEKWLKKVINIDKMSSPMNPDKWDSSRYLERNVITLGDSKKLHARVALALTTLYEEGGHGVRKNEDKAKKVRTMTSALAAYAGELCPADSIKGKQGNSSDIKNKWAGEDANKELFANARRGDAQAQFLLAHAYAGHSRPPEGKIDKAEALKWYRKAAEQGHAEAQERVGSYIFHNEERNQHNLKEALKWYRLAAAQGRPNAQRMVKTIEQYLEN